MRARLIIGWLILLSLLAAIGFAQQPPAAAAPAAARRLSIAEALDIARRNNPTYLSSLNDRWEVGARRRSAFLNLFTPSASANASWRHSDEGTTYIQGVPSGFASGENRYTSWSLGAQWSLSGQTIATRGLTAANARATEADISGALRTLETNVRSQYLSLLQARARVGLAQHSVERAQEQLSLAQARYGVGQGTLVDVRNAEVGKGQAEVNLLTANQAVENETLRMFQQLGVPAPESVQLELTDSFPVTRPAFVEDSLIRLALDENPGLVAYRARARSARWSTRSAYSEYGPSLQLQAGFGWSRSSTADAGDPLNPLLFRAASIQKGNSPLSVSLGLSLPIYDGFARAADIQRARAYEDDVHLSIRAGELAVRAGVSQAHRQLIAAYQTIQLQQSNKAAAAEALDLATQRYRVGAGTYIELLTARESAEKADADYVNAVYDYHKAIAALENAVGRPLR
jgi:outer membrane protein